MAIPAHMRKNLGSSSTLYPMPVLIVAAYAEDGSVSALNAAWGCIADNNKVGICLEESHKTTKDLLARGAFTVSFATSSYVTEADYLGIVSGNKVPDKFVRSGLHATRSDKVDAPLIDELPLALECRVESAEIVSEDTIWLIGSIVDVSADESILGDDGKVDVEKLDPIVMECAHHTYMTLGKKVGDAFSIGKKRF